MSGLFVPPTPQNEPVLSYAPGRPERAEIARALAETHKTTKEIPLYVGGEHLKGGPSDEVLCPHEHHHAIGRAYRATAADVTRAIQCAMESKRSWAALPWEARASVFLKAADLLAGRFRAAMNASTMLGQSKTVHQSEIDAVAELCDFWRFNVHFYRELMGDQPLSAPGTWNRIELRPLDGFVFAVSPFNFTSIAGNLVSAPALLGNSVVWKPAPTQLHSARIIVEVLEAAGLPPGVVNMLHGDAAAIGEQVLASPDLGGLHFTGSTKTFQRLWAAIGGGLERYRQYPRIVGETGGKDFVFAHRSADVDALATALLRGAFEFQGQKCSAASRAYVPRSLWDGLRERLVAEVATMKVGDPTNFGNFMGAVIDGNAYQKITGYLELARASSDCKIVAGGQAESEIGWFVWPTVIEVTDPRHRLMREEIFGPVLSVFVYKDEDLELALDLCDQSAPYALTGAIFASDRRVIQQLSERLRFTAGNFYVNDKPTGAVVGQQPFGGGRASGTNDKAGSAMNLLRWASPRAIKENFAPPVGYRYPFMAEE